MLEARVTKAIVVQDDITMEPVLLGVCQYNDEYVNFRVPFDKETAESYSAEFFRALREQLAEDFDIQVYRVDLQEELLLKRMTYYAKQLSGEVH